MPTRAFHYPRASCRGALRARPCRRASRVAQSRTGSGSSPGVATAGNAYSYIPTHQLLQVMHTVTYLHTQTSKHTNKQPCMYTYMHAYMYAFIHTYIHAYTCPHAHSHTHTCTCTCTCIHPPFNPSMRPCIHTSTRPCKQRIHASTRTSTYVCAHAILYVLIIIQVSC